MNFGFKSVENLDSQSRAVVDYGKFGINSKSNLIRFEYTKNTTGSESEVIATTFKLENGTEYNYLIFAPNVRFATDPNSEEWKKELDLNKELAEVAASQIAEAIVPAEYIENAMNTSKPTTFKEFAETLERVIKATAGWNTKPLDLFLQWQSKPGKNQKRTYLEVPPQSTLKFGNTIFVTAEQPGGPWKEDLVAGKGLFIKNESGDMHKIKRNKWFVDSSNNTKITVLEDGSDDVNTGNTNNASTGGGNW